MNKFRTYDDLLKEEAALQSSLATQRAEIRKDVMQIREHLRPVTTIISFLSKLLTRRTGNSALVATGIGIAGDLILKSVILKKSGWLTRLVLPFLAKNYTSHIFGNGHDNIFHRLGQKIKGVAKK